MTIGYLEIDLSFPEAQSLKDKRQILMSLKTKLRQVFNISVAEIGEQDLWQSGRLGIVTISNEQQHANEVLSKVAGFVERFDGTVMQDYRTQFI
ncbi:MAG: DUF503 domain-containing protein [Verrucomicrobia bacterium]|nr:DUF503 domain-containing protein [Verrucomicrobiota bacterium]